jgi:hypothetical protein
MLGENLFKLPRVERFGRRRKNFSTASKPSAAAFAQLPAKSSQKTNGRLALRERGRW